MFAIVLLKTRVFSEVRRAPQCRNGSVPPLGDAIAAFDAHDLMSSELRAGDELCRAAKAASIAEGCVHVSRLFLDGDIRTLCQ